MQKLGATRSSCQRDHSLLTPDTFVRAPLPGMSKATAIIHAAPAHGAGFTEYTVEFEAGGAMQVGEHQSFLYVLEGSVRAAGHELRQSQFAYLPAHRAARIESEQESRIIVVEKALVGSGEAPDFLTGDETAVKPRPLLGDPAVEVRTLLPDDFAFDFAVNTMTFQPGASLPMVEAHVMEHGLLMLEGGGIYRLGEHWYPVTAGDFIWMAPYCPQWFGAIGKTPAKYLIYKDWNRHPLLPR
ncbi:MAG: (S)-ureidoglycine aminohydrolase [Acidobacteriota bacterium]|nr:(S)-ureidoglycine aminohydrolase [Acidobacteriota bacterium]